MAETQENLESALVDLGKQEGGSTRFEMAATAYREALDIFRSVKTDDKIKKVSKELDAVERLLRARHHIQEYAVPG